MSSANVFVSHSHRDRETALYLDRTLKSRGAQTFLDHEQIGVSVELTPTILGGLKRCDVLLLLWSHGAATSTWVNREWRTAKKLGKRIVPYVLDGSSLPPELEDIVFVDASDRGRGHVGLLRAIFGAAYRPGATDLFPGAWRVEVDAGRIGGSFDLELIADGQVSGTTGGLNDSHGVVANLGQFMPGIGELLNRPLPVTGSWEFDDRQRNLTLKLTCYFQGQRNTETIVIQTTGQEQTALRGRDSMGRTYRVWRVDVLTRMPPIDPDLADLEADERGQLQEASVDRDDDDSIDEDEADEDEAEADDDSIDDDSIDEDEADEDEADEDEADEDEADEDEVDDDSIDEDEADEDDDDLDDDVSQTEHRPWVKKVHAALENDTSIIPRMILVGAFETFLNDVARAENASDEGFVVPASRINEAYWAAEHGFVRWVGAAKRALREKAHLPEAVGSLMATVMTLAEIQKLANERRARVRLVK